MFIDVRHVPREQLEMKNAARTLAATGAVLALALTGCAAQNPQNAATVGGTTISEDTIQTQTTDLANALQTQPSQIRLSVVNSAILGAVSQQLAQQNNMTITPAQRQQIIAQVPQLAHLAQTEGGKQYVDNATTYVAVARKIGEDKFLTGCSKLDVTVNPRYGQFIPESCQLSGTTGSLSNPVPTATPQP